MVPPLYPSCGLLARRDLRVAWKMRVGSVERDGLIDVRARRLELTIDGRSHQNREARGSHGSRARKPDAEPTQDGQYAVGSPFQELQIPCLPAIGDVKRDHGAGLRQLLGLPPSQACGGESELDDFLSAADETPGLLVGLPDHKDTGTSKAGPSGAAESPSLLDCFLLRFLSGRCRIHTETGLSSPLRGFDLLQLFPGDPSLVSVYGWQVG